MIKIKLNVEEFTKLRIAQGWSMREVAEIAGLTNTQIWKMCLPIDNQYFCTAGLKSRKALKNVFPDSPNLFLPLDLRLRKKQYNEEEFQNGATCQNEMPTLWDC